MFYVIVISSHQFAFFFYPYQKQQSDYQVLNFLFRTRHISLYFMSITYIVEYIPKIGGNKLTRSLLACLYNCLYNLPFHHVLNTSLLNYFYAKLMAMNPTVVICIIWWACTICDTGYEMQCIFKWALPYVVICYWHLFLNYSCLSSYPSGPYVSAVRKESDFWLIKWKILHKDAYKL